MNTEASEQGSFVQTHGKSIGVAVVLVMAVGLLGWWLLAHKESTSPTFLVLDTRKILAASTKQIIENKSLSNEQVAQVSEKLARNMQALLAEYQATGRVVLNSSTVLSYPPEVDITADFAEKLGVKLE